MSDVRPPLNVKPGTVEEALAHGYRLLEEHPATALAQAQTLLRSGPDPRALRLAAAAHRRLGMADQAEKAELAAIQASFGNKDLEQAAVAEHERRSADARTLATAVLRAEPDDLLAMTIAAESGISLRLYSEADAFLRRVLERAPSFLRASVLRAKLFIAQSRMREAITLLQRVLDRKPDNRQALAVLAEALAEVGDHEETIAVYEKLLSLEAGKAETWIMYAQYLRIVGRKDDSKAAFRKALSLDPGHGAAWWGLTHFFPSEIDAEDEQAMERVLAERGDSAEHAGPVHIALSIVAERRQDHEQAFRHVAQGKSLRAQAKFYNPDFMSADVDQALQEFSPDLYSTRAGCGSAAASPIFLVGMPRSGSTLVERILGRHSQVEATGELQILPRLVDQLRHRDGRPQSYSAAVAAMSCEELARLGDMYVERARDFRRTDKPMFVDKLNLNWLHSGLIRLALPNARIIDVRRASLDCCWSNFKMLFAAGHANDLRHLGRFYRDYVRMVAGIDAAAPGGILPVRYEEVVEDIETQTRRMLAFLGLEFEEECLAFHLSDEPVATPSSEQVRRPLNRDSIGSAEPYRPWLGPLIDELGPLADA